MRVWCDENIKRSVTTLLQQAGYDVVRVQDELDVGFADEDIITFCRETDRVLVTNDDDFFQFETHPGICFLDEQRTPPRDVMTAMYRLDRYVSDLSDQVWHVPDGWV